jgi:hypothetical protein
MVVFASTLVKQIRSQIKRAILVGGKSALRRGKCV